MTALPAWSQTRGGNFLNRVQGDVVVGRFLITPDQATEGMLLSTSHQIRVGTNSQATLNCRNGGIHTFDRADTYNVGDYCSAGNDVRAESRRGPSRGTFNASLPYVLTPRNTALIPTDSLVLQWHPVEEATSYEITLSGSGVNWTTQVSEAQVSYPDIAALRPDYRYTIVITSDNGLSSASVQSIGFAVLSPSEDDRVNTRVEEIEARQLGPDVEAIALALEYINFQHSDPDRQSYALNQAALDVLEERIDAGTNNSLIYLLQAETYFTVGLPLMAQERYEQALIFAQEAEQRELQAESYLGLATVADGQTEYRDAIAHLQSAQQLYEELGDYEQAEALQVRINLVEEIL
ncbi:MAG: hypothetical protein AAGA75_00550 [Cyanobacteria bacterium P01_E01_bin.6]